MAPPRIRIPFMGGDILLPIEDQITSESVVHFAICSINLYDRFYKSNFELLKVLWFSLDWSSTGMAATWISVETISPFTCHNNNVSLRSDLIIELFDFSLIGSVLSASILVGYVFAQVNSKGVFAASLLSLLFLFSLTYLHFTHNNLPVIPSSCRSLYQNITSFR